MGNTFGAHLFKRRSVGEREEVTIKLFKMDGTPLNVGEAPDPVDPPDLSTAVLAAWQGAFDTNLDYAAGSLVRHAGATYLATRAALHTAPDPGASDVMARFPFYQNGDKNAYVLPRDVEVVIADLENGGGYEFPASRWFQIVGEPGEALTFSAVGGGTGNRLGVTRHDTLNGPYPLPKTIIVPVDGEFVVEVPGAVTTFKYVGPLGPQPAGNPWTLFA
jgi:hypothetical protein